MVDKDDLAKAVEKKEREAVVEGATMALQPALDRMMLATRQLQGVGAEGLGDLGELNPMEKVQASQAIRALTGKAFRNKEQARAFQILWKAEENALIVLPTGSGKSTLVLALAKMEAKTEKGMTVIVVPLNSLLHDLQRRCEREGVPFVMFSDLKDAYDSEMVGIGRKKGLVLVQVDMMIEDKCRDFMAKLNPYIERFILDEAHFVCTWDFREALLRLHSGLSKDKPLIALTATMPPSFYPVFGKRMRRDFSILFRGTATSTNVHYQVSTCVTFAA